MKNPNDPSHTWSVYRLRTEGAAGWTTVTREKLGEHRGSLGEVMPRVDASHEGVVLFVPHATPTEAVVRQNGALGSVAAGIDLSEECDCEAEVVDGRIGQFRFSARASQPRLPPQRLQIKKAEPFQHLPTTLATDSIEFVGSTMHTASSHVPAPQMLDDLTAMAAILGPAAVPGSMLFLLAEAAMGDVSIRTTYLTADAVLGLPIDWPRAVLTVAGAKAIRNGGFQFGNGRQHMIPQGGMPVVLENTRLPASWSSSTGPVPVPAPFKFPAGTKVRLVMDAAVQVEDLSPTNIIPIANTGQAFRATLRRAG